MTSVHGDVEADTGVAGRAPLRDHLLEVLSRSPRIFSPRFFYDTAGAALFERICELDEYYLTRTEEGIHARHAHEIAARIGCNARIVEFGSGSGRKTRRLLAAFRNPSAYLPVDVSGPQLAALAREVAHEHPSLVVQPIWADFSSDFLLRLPPLIGGRTVAFYHGSTFGNFHPDDASHFLVRVSELCGADAGLLVGVDLRKDRGIIERAYNDAAGVTAAFNLNLLRRANRECGTDFDLASFGHDAVYDDGTGRIEMRLVSSRAQIVTVPQSLSEGPRRFFIDKGEKLTTEYSYKYDIRQFEELAASSGWQRDRFWTDERGWFGVWLLRQGALHINCRHSRECGNPESLSRWIPAARE
jgi:dimethylhistidine N-methyltransferase